MSLLTNYILPEGNVQISFSGGRTSGFMLHQILEANGGLPDRAKVVFSNTGREMPQTLDFVQECSDRFDVHIDWVEYIPTTPLYEMVNHNSASRNGEPFAKLVERRKYLPNALARFCTADLKIRPAKRHLVQLGWKNWIAAIGIRADEPRRINRDKQKERWQRWYPLADDMISRHDVIDWWKTQDFDLGLEAFNGNSALGNCDGCFLKSEASLAMLTRDYPDRALWWEKLEDRAGELTSNPNGARFRKEYDRKSLRKTVERQGDWIFNDKEYLCQADHGECIT